MNAPTFLSALLTATVFAASAHGAPITQPADANSTVSPWSDYGDLAAQQWHSLDLAPWDAKPAAPPAVANTSVHKVSAKAPLVDIVDAAIRISEPASELLMLVALGGLAIVVRRKMPE